MKIKSILRIAAFSIAFVFSAAFAGLFADKSETVLTVTPSYDAPRTSCFGRSKMKSSSSAAAAKINRILQTDDENGEARNARVRRVSSDYNPPFAVDSSFDAFADATARYAEQSGKIEYASVSPEFKASWRRHMRAWSDYADFLQSFKSRSVRNELGVEAFEQYDDEYNLEINQSWYEVLHVAEGDGADAEFYWMKSGE